MKNCVVISLLGLILLLSGCAQSVPQPQLYLLNPDLHNISSKLHSSKTILILPTTAAPAIDTDKIAYATSKYQINYYTRNSWVVAPAKQMTSLIVQALQHSHLYRGVVTAPYSGVVDLRLTTQLIALTQILYNNHSTVHMVLAAQLINANTGRLIASTQFTDNIIAPINNVHGGILAANRATKMILQRLVIWLATNAH